LGLAKFPTKVGQPSVPLSAGFATEKPEIFLFLAVRRRDRNTPCENYGECGRNVDRFDTRKKQLLQADVSELIDVVGGPASAASRNVSHGKRRERLQRVE